MDLLTAESPEVDRPTSQPESGDERRHGWSGSRLVIVGLGMAGYGLCDRLDRNGFLSQLDVTVIGDEPTPAYDRVNLSKVFDGAATDDLLLAPADWYKNQKIELVTGRRVVAIDRRGKLVTDDHGASYSYDRLVLATGSRAWVPPIKGVDLPGVFVYRTLDDLQRIKQFVGERRASVGAVIGGGLLGLEAAKILTELGVRTQVIEMAPGLMPRQLDAEGAQVLKERVEAIGVEVHLVRRTEAIASAPGGKLNLRFTNADDSIVDLLIVAAGVRPNDQLADRCGLEKGPRGGIEIDPSLATSDPNIFAIGECASFRDHVYGLVAPCYRMADVLADRLAGGSSRFDGADESAELKLLGVQVVTLGKAIGETPGVIPLTHHHQDGYRKVLIAQGRVVGASCVGPWEELPQIRRAIGRQQFLWPWQRLRFSRTGTPWTPGGVLPIHQWPDDSVICSCLGVSKATVNRSIRDNGGPGLATVESIASACGASSACGSCRGLVSELAGGVPESPVVPGNGVLSIASILALSFVVSLAFVTPPGLADSVQSSWRRIDVLWRSDFARQVTGFTLLGVTAIGMLFSLRKRLGRFRIGRYSLWRAMHGVLGTAALVAMAVHTGLRLGSNLNFVLGVCFLLAIVLGAFAGMSTSMETRFGGTTALSIRLWRTRLAKIHLWVTWPLPVLIALHILSFYWFSD
jgi:nitrite reductase (NADH) large subunit